ncbi:MAG: nuclear transport factor 2 family protein [bacterium]|nr:nuclear transport factor 2 family protein [bacterium]
MTEFKYDTRSHGNVVYGLHDIVKRSSAPRRTHVVKQLHRAYKITFLALTIGFLSLGCSYASDRPTVAEQFERYAKASASHDLAALEALTADDIVWVRGPHRHEGKKNALGPNAFDAGVKATLVFRNVKVEGNIVEFELIETSGVIRAVGMTKLLHYVRFEFENGLVKRKMPGSKKPPAKYSRAEFVKRMTPLRKWILETHPEAIPRLVDSRRAFIFSEESGALMLKLAEQWAAAGAPGRLATQIE